MSKSNVDEKINYIPMVERALDIVELLYDCGGSMGVSEIASKLCLPKANVYRILATMEKKGYILQNYKSDKYSLGYNFIKIGEQIKQKIDLNEIAQPFMEQLAEETGETVYLCRMFNQEALIINTVNGETSTLNAMVAPLIPLYCSSLGRSLMIDYSEKEIDKYIQEKGMPSRTISTITTKEQLIAEINRIKQDGIGIEVEEYEYGMLCIAGPIRDSSGRLIGSMSISGPTSRIRHKGEAKIAEKVKHTCLKITDTMIAKRI